MSDEEILEQLPALNLERIEAEEWLKIVKGAPYEVVDDSVAAQLGEPVAELRACMSDNVTTPDAVAQVAVQHWMQRPDLREALLDRWQRIGLGFDWDRPDPEGIGVVLLVLLHGETTYTKSLKLEVNDG